MLGAWFLFAVGCATAAEPALPPTYAEATKKVAAKFAGQPGVVLHIGDSITYANPYGAWPRYGEGKTEADKAVLKWMHTNGDKEKDGWILASKDHPDGGRSDTAASGIQADQLREGGFSKMLSFDKLLAKYQPQVVVLMIGTNDASAQRTTKAYMADVTALIASAHDRGVILILSTIPPHHDREKLANEYNEALRALAKEKGIPLIDYDAEIRKRRPNDWNGTLLGKNDVHPTATVDKVTALSPPTEANLAISGYLLRGWLGVQKIAEVKAAVIDAQAKK